MNAFLPKTTRKAPQHALQSKRSSTRYGVPDETSASRTVAFVDKRPEAIVQRKFQTMADQRQLGQPQSRLQAMVEHGPRQVIEPQQLERLSGQPVQRQEALEGEELLQSRFDPLQRQTPEDEELLQGRFTGNEPTMQREGVEHVADNRTGMPNPLKAGLEQLSGIDLSDVRVHYNSAKPVQLGALAYAQGQDIHLGPGQEQHLPHEGWHTVQQMQGRVKPTMQAQGVSINDDTDLEHEADVMGAKALQMRITDQVAAGSYIYVTPTAPRENEAMQVAGTSGAAVGVSRERMPLNALSMAILETQQTAGDQAVQRRLANGTPVLKSHSDNIQLKPVPGKLNITTHLIKMKGSSLLEGEQQQRVYPNDVLVLEDRDRVWSRRGVDGERRQEFHRNESTTDYKYYRVLKYNNADVRSEPLYVRYTTFDFMASEDVDESVAEAEKTIALREMLRDTDEMLSGNIRLARKTNRLLARFADIIDSAPENSNINKEAFGEAFDAATGEIEGRYVADALSFKRRARDERYKANPRPEKIAAIHNNAVINRQDILGALAYIELEAVNVGRSAMQDRDEGTDEAEAGIDLWREVLVIGDAAYDLRTKGTAEAKQRISALSASAKENFNTLYGYFGNVWDGFGVVAASAEALAAITALSVVIATVGMAIGIIAAELGMIFAVISHKREKDLAETQSKLEEREFSEDLAHIAEYAKKQKNKKKKRQMIVAAGGLAVAVMAGVGLIGGPVAIVMAVLGAAVGIGFILYKWYRKKKGKKQAMRALIRAAVDADDAESIAALLKLGITDEEIESAVGNSAAYTSLEAKVEKTLKNKRVDTANRLVVYVKNGKPSEKVGAEAILFNLGIYPAKVRNDYSHSKAVSKVASKLSSW